MQLIITRQNTAIRARKLGLECTLLPLFTIEAVAWDKANAADYDGLLITSANAIAFGGAHLETLRDLPVLAVGEASAAAARKAGFDIAITGTSNAAALIESTYDAGLRRLLWITGEDHNDPAHPDDMIIVKRIAYAARANPVPDLSPVLTPECIITLHSPRAAVYFGQMVDSQNLRRDVIVLAVFSPAVGKAAGDGWRDIIIADTPSDSALLSAVQSRAKDRS